MKKYIITVLGISWITTGLLFLNPETALTNFSIIMFIPLLITLIFRKADEKKTGCKSAILKKGFNKKAMLFGCLYPVCFIAVCALLALALKQGTFTAPADPVVWGITMLVTVFVGLFSAFGEEYGWRGYLLPNLTLRYGRRKAVMLTGLVWSLYHIPSVYLLARLTGMENPLLVCGIQASVVFVSNFAFSYCYYLSESIIPVIFYHSVWNAFNTSLLGDIYNTRPGIIKGNIPVINGEGQMGLLLAIPAMIFFWLKLAPKRLRPLP